MMEWGCRFGILNLGSRHSLIVSFTPRLVYPRNELYSLGRRLDVSKRWYSHWINNKRVSLSSPSSDTPDAGLFVTYFGLSPLVPAVSSSEFCQHWKLISFQFKCVSQNIICHRWFEMSLNKISYTKLEANIYRKLMNEWQWTVST
jgi:hypothetical protein